jgi:hypothetical protein
MPDLLPFDMAVFDDKNADGTWKPWGALSYARRGDLQPLIELLGTVRVDAPGLTECLRFTADELAGKHKRPRGRPKKQRSVSEGLNRILAGRAPSAVDKLTAILAGRYIEAWRRRHPGKRRVLLSNGDRAWLVPEAVRRAIARLKRAGRLQPSWGGEKDVQRIVALVAKGWKRHRS